MAMAALATSVGTITVLDEVGISGEKIKKLVTEALNSTELLSRSKDDVEKKIKELKVEHAKLKESTKEHLQEGSRLLIEAETRIETNRRLLESLATDTISRTEKVKEYFNMLDDTDIVEDKEALEDCIHTAVEDFIHLLNASKVTLDEASMEYKNVLRLFEKIQIKLNDYKYDIEQMCQVESTEYEEWTHKIRTAVYASVGVVTLGVGLAVAAPIVETEISKYWHVLQELKKNVGKTVIAADKLLRDVDRKATFVQDEVQLITNWSMSIKQALEREKEMKEIATTLANVKGAGMKKLLSKKKEVINGVLDNLTDSCKKYLEHKL